MPGPDLRKLYQTLLKQAGKEGGVYRKDFEGNLVPVQYFAGGNNEKGYIGDTEKSNISTTNIETDKPYWLKAKEYYKENYDKSIDRINSTPAYLKMMGDDISRKIKEEEDQKSTEWGKKMANPNYGTNQGEVMIGDNNPFKRTILGQLSSDIGMKNRAERFTGSKHEFYDPNMEEKNNDIDLESFIQPQMRQNQDYKYDFNNKDRFYRVVHGSEAYDDIINNKVIRSGSGAGEGKFKRPTAYPSFSKGKASMEYAASNDNHLIISTKRPMGVSTLGRHGKGTTQFPVDERGKYMKSFPSEEADIYRHIGNGKYQLEEFKPKLKYGVRYFRTQK